jgi:hypothetical protein
MATYATTVQAAPYPAISGVVENYFGYDFGGRKNNFGRTVTWAYSETQLGPNTTLVNGFLNYNSEGLFDAGRSSLDENYVEQNVGTNRFRVGRIRTAFGFSDWSEMFYQGLPRKPLARLYPFGGGLSLQRVDAGAEWQVTKGASELTVAAIDARTGRFDVNPDKVTNVAVRYQRYQGAFIVGLNTLLLAGREEADSRLYGFDVRWTSPHVQVRSEWDYDTAAGYRSQGMYTDVMVHPPGLLRTTFAGRVEQVSGMNSFRYTSYGAPVRMSGTAYTLGVKQILSPALTAELSRTWNAPGGSLPASSPYTLQLMTSAHF